MLTFDRANSDAVIIVSKGSHVISTPVVLARNTLVTVGPADSILSITSPLSASGVTLTKTGEGILEINSIHAGGLTINAGTVKVADTSTAEGASVVNSLSIAGPLEAPTAKLDLNNALIVNYSGPSPAANIHQQILAGRGKAGFGATWNGMGITSSAAAAANAAEPESRAIGYAENAALPAGPYTEFRGEPVDTTSVLITYTRTGDANLDGTVNDDDVTIMSSNYAPGVSKPFWALGDFDYNGFVDDDDVTLLGAFYNPNATPLIGASPAIPNTTVPVPEPRTASLVVIGLLIVAALSRRNTAWTCRQKNGFGQAPPRPSNSSSITVVVS